MNYIFVIDIDGTMIGNCTYQALLYKFILYCKKSNINININEYIHKIYNQDNKLLRPFFIYFMKKIKQYYKNVYFYVYTSSNKDWANKEISFIEKENNIKFNRPIFTRDDCIIIDNLYKKSVLHIIKKIKIKGEYQLMIIDNLNVYSDMIDNLLLCPTYNYTIYENLWDYLPIKHYNDLLINEYIKKKINITMPPYNNNINLNQREKTLSYKWLYKFNNKINKKNKKDLNDLFWKNLTDYLINNNITEFNKKTIKTINNIIDI